ncbi:23S rRNA (uracil(1939)-C(5))-methyltransferase RlmD [Candidatus Woesearchaeota archaeon]|nr:23S rRNA (uracil(1939)-C(5))-methyltransferase RlmD [Candidatus Woesearchaeota archaeon]
MTAPLCHYFGKCGGCTLQHLDYSLQRENKRKRLGQILDKVVDFDEEKIKIFFDKEYYYRNRMDFLFTPKGLGMREKGSTVRVIDVEQCVIASEGINLVLRELRSYFKDNDYYNLISNKGTLKSAVVRSSRLGEKAVCFMLNGESSHLGEVIEKIKQFAKQTSADKVILISDNNKEGEDNVEEDNILVVKGTEFMREKLSGKEFSYPIFGFFQNNSFVGEKMQDYVRELLTHYNTKGAKLLDLYAGVGTFGIINADLFESAAIMESFMEGIAEARKNVVENKIMNALTYNLDAKQLRKVPLSGKLFVIVDPPRSGMDSKVIQQLQYLKPEVIIYVSCNPEQLGKDLVKFKDYKLKSAALFDMFPQTSHSEVVAELARKIEKRGRALDQLILK